MLRHFIVTLALSVGLLTAGACETSAPVDARDLAELARAQHKWRTRPFADYSYEISVHCFCPPEIGQWNRVTVRGNAVTAVEPVDLDAPYAVSMLSYWRPIDSLFVEVFRAMSAPASDSYLDAVIVKYHDALGYPTQIEYRARRNVADGGALYDLRNVRPLP